MATSVNPYAGPSLNPNPSGKELFRALCNYLSTQDLMTVTYSKSGFILIFADVYITDLCVKDNSRGDYGSIPKCGPCFMQRLFEPIN